MRSVELKLWYSCKSATWADHIKDVTDTLIAGKVLLPIDNVVGMQCSELAMDEAWHTMRIKGKRL